jgi:hypothetical protein
MSKVADFSTGISFEINPFAATILTKIKCIIITVEHPKAWRDRYEKNVFYHDKEPAFVLYGFVSDRPFATAKE